MGISVVATSFNLGKEGILSAILEAWERQSVVADEYILSDVQSTDNTAEIVESFKDRIPVRLEVRPDTKGWADQTIDYGVRKATQDIVIICHAEMLFRDDTVELMTSDLGANVVRRPGVFFPREWSIETILAASPEDRFAVATQKAFTAHDVNGTGLPFHSATSWVCSFHRKNWPKIQPVSCVNGHGPDDAWFQHNIGRVGSLEYLKVGLFAHLRHTRPGHPYYRDPTKTFRDPIVQ